MGRFMLELYEYFYVLLQVDIETLLIITYTHGF